MSQLPRYQRQPLNLSAGSASRTESKELSVVGRDFLVACDGFVRVTNSDPVIMKCSTSDWYGRHVAFHAPIGGHRAIRHGVRFVAG